MSVILQANQFLKQADYFDLGHIITEQPHPKTGHLSDLVKQNMNAAIKLLQEIDLDALEQFADYLPQIHRLQKAVASTLHEGGRIYLCGCGATGRLSLSLENLWRSLYNTDQVCAFMAGGDIALVHSIEDFEDYSEYGAKHLQQLGFTQNDLLISCTEGGETPYVIGATEYASRFSKRNPFFLYCNPDDVLEKIERSRNILLNADINKISLFVGPMAIAGSTRMQASTVLQLAVGLALFFKAHLIDETFKKFTHTYQSCSLDFLQGFIQQESDIYRQNDFVHYLVRDFGITVFTDTTERAPTFSLAAFDNLQHKQEHYSLSYISLSNTNDKTSAWKELLGRPAHSLDWQDINNKTSSSYLESFDFSNQSVIKRKTQIPDHAHHYFVIEKNSLGILWTLDSINFIIKLQPEHPLIDHLILKLLLNIHSTLVMGNLNRYTGNLMTYVSPTNGKLIDRAARYVKHLLKQDEIHRYSYADIVHELFKQKQNLRKQDSIVLQTYAALSRSTFEENLTS